MLRLREFVRRPRLPRQPIIFDFVAGRAYRAESEASLADSLASKLQKVRKPRVVKTVIGVPPAVLTQPKK